METEAEFSVGKKREGNKKMSGFTVLLVVEAVLLCICMIQYIMPLHSYVYQGNDLTAAVCRHTAYGDYGVGCYLDQELVSDSSVDPSYLYISNPAVDLPKGSYQVSIVYSTDDPDQKYVFTSKYRTYPVIAGHNGNRLPTDADRVDIVLSSPVPVKEFQVHINYSGDGYLFVESIAVNETNAWKNILLFWVLLCSLVVDGFFLCYQRAQEGTRRRMRVTWAVLIGLTAFVSTPLFSFYISEADDLIFHLNRIEAIRSSLLVGQVPNRVSTFWNKGYGYASAVLYGEIFLYVPALLRLLGFSVQGAYKVYVILVNLGTVLIAYHSFRKVFCNERAAMVGSAAYVMAPSRLVCIYMRAAVGEYTAVMFFPLIFYGLLRIFWGNEQDPAYKRSYILLALGFSGLIQSHVISCVIAAGFTGLFCLVFIRRTLSPKRLLQMVRAVVWTVFANLWFLLPFLDYMHLGYADRPTGMNLPGRMNSQGTFLSQMFTLFQMGDAGAYTVSTGLGNTNERNYALGVFVFAAVFYLVYRLYQGKGRSRFAKMGDYSLAFALLSGFMCSIWFPWDYFQQMNGLFGMIVGNLQFPWRFLGICCFFLTVVTVCLICLLESCENRWLYRTVIVVLGAFMTVSADYYMYNYTQTAPMYRYDHETQLYSGNVGAGEYLLKETPDYFLDDTGSVPGDGVEVFEEDNTGDGRTVTCRNMGEDASTIDLPLLPYRGYVCRDQETGEEFTLQPVPGRLRVTVPGRYNGVLRVRYEEPWYWRAAEIISAMTLLGWAAGAVLEKRGYKRKRITQYPTG